MTDATKALLMKPRWTDPTDLYIGDIIEYDMKDGGYSIIRQEKLAPESFIKKLGEIPKEGRQRDIFIGKLVYNKDPMLKQIPRTLETMFTKYRVFFGEANELEEDDIFSIKRDAIFLKHYASQLEFGDYIKFVEKHIYDVYFLLGENELVTNFASRHKTYEVYYNTHADDIAVKGIGDDKLVGHEEFIIAAIKRYLRYLVTFDYEGATRYVVKLIDDYKFFRLPVGYYREFNSSSLFKLQVAGRVYETEEADQNVLQYMDIRYNFNHILVPMLNMASLGLGRGNQSNKTR